VNFYDFHIGDYASRTAHLEPMEDIAYRRMLDLYYIREEPLPWDVQEIARLIRMRGQEAVIKSILAEFFIGSEGEGWLHDKCEKVIAAAQEKRSKAQASAAHRWGKDKPDANAMRTHSEGTAPDEKLECEGNAPSPSPSPTTHKKPPKPPKGGEPVGFEEFYAAYPKKQGREAAAKAFAKVVTPLAVLLDALSWQCETEGWTKDNGKFIPMAATWLHGKRWEDQRPVIAPEPRRHDSAEQTARMLDEQMKGTKGMPAEMRGVVAQLTGRKVA
jgi:uncharacterized protein YdaU (DUF1376 family)